MWRWVGIACLIYGLSSLGLMFAPRHPSPGASPPPDGELTAAIDFENQFPPPITRPQAETRLTQLRGGNHALEWLLPPRGPRVRSLALPMRPQPGAVRLVLEAGADRERELRIGLREADGSVYLAPRRVGVIHEELSVRFDELRLAEFMDDENRQFDPAQVTAVVVICPELRTMRNQQGPAVITLDNLRFE